MNVRKTQLVAITAILVLALLPTNWLLGQTTYHWINTNNISPWYDINTNWNPLGPPGALDLARFQEVGTYEVWWDGYTGNRSVESLEAYSGQITFVNQMPTSQWELTVNGNLGGSGDIRLANSGTSLTIQGLHLNSLGDAFLQNASLTVDGASSAGTTLSVAEWFDVDGVFRIQSGGLAFVDGQGTVSSVIGTIGGGSGTATVSGTGSQWHNARGLRVGDYDQGTLTIEAGGLVTNTFGTIGHLDGSTGIATVTGSGSQWFNSGDLRVGSSGNGTLNIEAGGVITNETAIIGSSPTGIGQATVTGTGSQWHTFGDLLVGANGQATLNIENGGLVNVSGTTTINTQSVVNLSGGHFQFGTATPDTLTRINGTGGSMGGVVPISGVTSAAGLTVLQNQLVNMDNVQLSNSGLLHGSALLDSSLNNQSGAEVRTLAGEWVRFAGNGNINAGELNNLGGAVEFAGTATNTSTGFISGRGQFIAGGGWTNNGVMAFSGTTDVLGDVNNASGGRIVTSGGATTTFYDDVLHNGTEIRTSAGSQTVIFGEATGGGSYTGTGTVFFEGDLRPGNSPNIVSFEGDVVLGTAAQTFIELAGNGLGEYDRLDVDGNFTIDGQLFVEIMDGFQLGPNKEFLIADIGDQRLGMFDSLGEGDLVGTYGKRELFISYSAGSGNDVVLFTGVPEPQYACLLVLLVACLAALRVRRGNAVNSPSIRP